MAVNIKAKVRRTPNINVKVKTGLLAEVVAGNGIDVDRVGGNFVVSSTFNGTFTGTWQGDPIAAIYGGTGQSSYTVGDMLYASTTTALAKLAASTSGFAIMANGAGVAPSYQGFLQAGTSAVTRTWQDKAREILSVKDFGAVGDGVTNDAAAINAAFAAGGASGKTVFFPPGVYRINSAITATGAPESFDIVGSGTGATKIRSTFATGDVLTYNVTNGTIRSLKFDSTVVRTSGATIKLIPNGALVTDVAIAAPYIGIENSGIVNRITDCRIGEGIDAGLGTGPITSRATSAGSGGIYNTGILQIATTTVSSGITTPAANLAEYGVRNRGEVDLVNSYLFLTNRGYWCDPQLGQGGIGSITGCWIDSVLDAGIVIDSTSGANEMEHSIVGNPWITCGYSSTAATACILLRGENTRYITIAGNTLVAYNGGVGQGIWLDQTPSAGVNANRIVITGNLIGLSAGLGFANGIFTSANVKAFNIVGNTFRGNTGDITLSSGADEYAIVANNTEGNISGTATSTTKKVALNVGEAGEAFDGTVTAASFTASDHLSAGTNIRWTSRSIMQSPADGRLLLLDNAGTSFDRLQFGGTTSSFPSIKRNGTALNFRLADDSADAGITALDATLSGSLLAVTNIRWQASTIMQAPADGQLLLLNNAANSFSRLQFGGTTASFPAIKRNSAALNFRLADDSADAAITAGAGTFSGTMTTVDIVSSGSFLATTNIRWQSSSIMQAPADGRILLLNNAANDFGRLQLGGTTSSFPAIKRNSTALNFRLADDSADAPITASTGTFSGAVTATTFNSATIDNTAWSSFTPTVTLTSGGPPTTSTANIRYKQLPGKVVVIRGTVAISNLNGGSGNVVVTLPVTESGAVGNVTALTGYNGTTAALFPCVISGGASSITFVVTAGLEQYNFSGTYQGA